MKRRPSSTIIPVAAVLGTALMICGCPGPKGRSKPTDKMPSGHGSEVAVIRLSGAMVERTTISDFLTPSRPVLHRVLKTMRTAKEDPAIGTVVVRIDEFRAGWAQLAELRQAFIRIRAAKKKLVVHLDSANNGTYYLASAADRIVMSPGASVWLLGLAMEMTFVKGLLGKLGIEADFTQMGRYKGAAEPLTRDSLSPALKESLEALLNSMHTELVSSVAEGRKLSKANVQAIIDKAPLLSEQAVASKLVDAVEPFGPSVRKLAENRRIHWRYGKKKSKTASLTELLSLFTSGGIHRPPTKPHVALVYAVGHIVQGSQQNGLLDDDDVIAAQKMERVLEGLRKNKAVKAVVVRIDSPGGSALASDQIWVVMNKLNKEKPVVVSMGNVAASGGYYIASTATRILAQPGTLTGSIGVVGGKLSLKGLFEKIGVTNQVLKRGARADLFSSSRKFTPDERKVIREMMRSVYEQFLDRVSKGRSMAKDKVRAVAEGRVWAGAAAKEQRLVDRLGGLYDAVVEARNLGKLPQDAKVSIYPRPRSLLEMLRDRLGPSHDSAGAFTHLSGSLGLVSLFNPSLAHRLKVLVRAAGLWKKEPFLLLLPYDLDVN